jgi:alpha-L-fucosidase
MSEYEPTWESLDSHEIPDWYEDAKLGIFIHWGIYSVPAWAPPGIDIAEALEEGFTDSPYAEWYPYFMHIEESETYDYHREHYGEDVEYVDFVDDWTAEDWDPEAWAEFFADVGAGYVVLTGEHHDGFPLWDTHYAKYNAAEMGPERDLVGDLCEAVRDRDMRFAASYHANYNYYQPGFEGLFGHPDYEGAGPMDDEGGPGAEYVDFMNAKHRELIRKYEPDLLWFDVPMADSDHLRAKELIADYYNCAAKEWDKDVAVNDRAATDTIGPTVDPERRDSDTYHGDFVTPEYASFDEARDDPWESCRGIGHSFGYNAAEGPEDHLTAEELVHSFVDIVSKNGNLLINVGPKADGTIPEVQRERLSALGEWLDVNGEAVFESRPWVTAEDGDADVEVRYTWREGKLYATAFEWPGDALPLSIPAHVDVDEAPDAALLTATDEVPVEVTLDDDRLLTSLPPEPDHEYGYIVRFANVVNPRVDAPE